MNKKLKYGLFGVGFMTLSGLVGFATLRNIAYQKHINTEPSELFSVEAQDVFVELETGEVKIIDLKDDSLKVIAKDKKVNINGEEIENLDSYKLNPGDYIKVN